MDNKFEEVDLSTPEGQQDFERLTSKEKEEIIDQTREVATKLTTMIELGAAKNYEEAYHKLEDIKSKEGTFKIIVALNGDLFLDVGGGRTLLGNTFEGARVEKIPGIPSIDHKKSNENALKLLDLALLLVRKPSGEA